MEVDIVLPHDTSPMPAQNIHFIKESGQLWLTPVCIIVLGRVYPDVAAVADNIALWNGGILGHICGISASERSPELKIAKLVRLTRDLGRYTYICG